MSILKAPSIKINRLNASFLAVLILAIAILLSGNGLIGKASASTAWRMPWPSGIIGTISTARRPPLHSKMLLGQRENAYDIILPAGTPVLAPVDSRLIWECRANSNNHRYIVLRPAGSTQNYSLAHVQAATVKNFYRQGEQIGVIAADRVNNPSCAISTGPHLHFGFPSPTFTVDNQTFHPQIALATRLSSSNSGTAHQPPSPIFDGGQSIPYIDFNVINLTVRARNLTGRPVYVQMWRPAVGSNPPREWNYSAVASSTSITFRDLDGPGSTFGGVDYFLVASLSPISPGTAAQRRTACYALTGGRQLCDRVRR